MVTNTKNPSKAAEILTVCSTKEATKLAKWIYYSSDVPCLKRKRIIVEKHISK
jgi:hypothetical protein